MKKGLKRKREGILKHVPALDKIVWKTDVPNEKQGVVNTAATIGVFAGANYNSILQLTKDLFTKEEELHKVRKNLAASEVCHLKDIKLLKEEHQDKETHWENKFDSLKQQLEKL